MDTATLELVQHPLATHFKHPLIDLGERENAGFAGVMSPAPEVGARREGVDHVFLEGAEEYYRRYQGFDFWKFLIQRACNDLGLSPPGLIVEFGCGFGNATLPALDLFPQAKVIATDISPNLLAILRRLLETRGLASRCLPAAMDAQKDYIKSGSADMVLGAAILHHLVQPEVFIDRAMDILKPGGVAVFFEPLEGGNAIVRLLCQEISREAKWRKESGPALNWIAQIPGELDPQILRERTTGWRDRNDKWAFPRSYLQALAKRAGATLQIFPEHDNKSQFRRHVSYMLNVYAAMKDEDLPPWAWEIVKRYDEDTFSPDMLTDLAMAGCVAFTKV